MHATTWMNLEIMLSERSQPQKTIYYIMPLTSNTMNTEIYRDTMQITGFLGLRSGGKQERLLVNAGFLFATGKMF